MNSDLDIAQNAEMSLIGGILIDGNALSRCTDIVSPDDFYYDHLKAIYKSMLHLSNSGKTIDFVTVFENVMTNGQYDGTDMRTLLLTCADLVPSVSGVR